MFYDERGNPDPNGSFEKVNGKLIVRDGRSVRFNTLLRDSAPGLIHFTDAEQAFADSGEGKAEIARARMIHSMTRNPEPFTDAMGVKVITDAVAAKAEGAARLPRLLDEERRAADAADLARSQYITSLCGARS